MLKDRGYIYTSKHEGWYAVSDETFYPQSAVQLILDPPTGRKMMVINYENYPGELEANKKLRHRLRRVKKWSGLRN